MSKAAYINYMDSMNALSTKNADIQYASAEIKRFAQLIFEQAISERDEARKLAEEWRDHAVAIGQQYEMGNEPPYVNTWLGKVLPWEVDDGV